jgi:hypothetical protein
MLLVLWSAFFAHGQSSVVTFKLVDGATLKGTPLAVKDTFLQVKLEDGSYTNVNWARISQETFRELEKNRMTAAYANIFLDPAPKSKTSVAKKEVIVKPVTRLERPKDGSLFSSPVTILMLLVVWAASIYAGYEVAVFRQRPPALVATLGGVLPILGPVIFLAMPTYQPKEEVVYEQVEQAPVEEAPAVVEEAPAAVEQEQPKFPPPVVYPRGQFTFNRRFFETKFAGFLKLVPGEAERDKVIHIRSARGEHTGQRLAKVEPNELYLQVRKGTATEDVMIPFNEIYEVVVKHKDA